jgi:transketolase
VTTFDQDQHVIADDVKKGAYVLSEAKGGDTAGLLLASGSEVSLALEAQRELEKDDIFVSVISMPSWDRFEKQSPEYKESVIPTDITVRLAIELGSSFGWKEYVGANGKLITIDHFGASAPANKLLEQYGFTVDNIVSVFKNLLNP